MLPQDVDLIALIVANRKVRLRPTRCQTDLVRDHGVRKAEQAQAGTLHAQEEVHILEVNEIGRIEKSDLLEGVQSDQHAATWRGLGPVCGRGWRVALQGWSKVNALKSLPEDEAPAGIPVARPVFKVRDSRRERPE